MMHERLRGFLVRLALVDEVAAATQNQALAAILFLYRNVFVVPLSDLPAYTRAKRRTRVPEVLEPSDVMAVFSQLEGVVLTTVQLLYGTGLRLNEAVSLRVKDVDLVRSVVVVRDGKGAKDRRSVLPTALWAPIRQLVESVRALHTRDLARGGSGAWLPGALGRQYPGAARDWRWASLFPSSGFVRDSRSVQRLRWHISPTTVQRSVATADRAAGINKRVTPHIFRHNANCRTMSSLATPVPYFLTCERGMIRVFSP